MTIEKYNIFMEGKFKHAMLEVCGENPEQLIITVQTGIAPDEYNNILVCGQSKKILIDNQKLLEEMLDNFLATNDLYNIKYNLELNNISIMLEGNRILKLDLNHLNIQIIKRIIKKIETYRTYQAIKKFDMYIDDNKLEYLYFEKRKEKNWMMSVIFHRTLKYTPIADVNPKTNNLELLDKEKELLKYMILKFIKQKNIPLIKINDRIITYDNSIMKLVEEIKQDLLEEKDAKKLKMEIGGLLWNN